MFRIICPQCKSKVKGWPRDFQQWWKGKRKCGNCGAWLELSNPFFVMILGMLVPAALLIEAKHRFGNLWQMMLLVVPAAWISMFVVFRVFARWRVVAGGLEDSIAIKRLARIVWIGITISVLAVVAKLVDGALTFDAMKNIKAETVDPQVSLDLLMGRMRFFLLRLWVYLGLIIAGLTTAGVASIMKGKARKAEIEQKSSATGG